MLEQESVFPGEQPRLNKGPQLTPRLVSLCKIDAEQGALRFDQAQSWLGLLSPAAQKMKDTHLLSAERTRKILRPWIDQELLQYKMFFVGQRGWMWLTTKGLKYFDVPLRYYASRHLLALPISTPSIPFGSCLRCVVLQIRGAASDCYAPNSTPNPTGRKAPTFQMPK